MLRGISVDQFVWTNVVSNYRAGADEATLAQSHAANYRCVRADGDSFFDPCLHRHPVRVAAARSEIVGQHRVWTKKHVIGDMHVLPHADAILDRHVVANRDSALDESMIADIAMRTDADVLQHMSKRPDTRPLANRIRLNQCLLVNEDHD